MPAAADRGRRRPAVCFVGGVGLETTANLLVAASDLSVVRLLRGAIRAADVAAGRGQAASGLGPAPSPEPRRVIEPEPRYEPRRVVRPEPRYEPRRVIHPEPRVAACPPPGAVDLCGCPVPPDAATQASKPASPYPHPIQPPWRVLPWECPPPPRPVLKVIHRKPDIVRKGAFIDTFI